MAATFVVTLREGFEAALLLGIVYACLDRFGARQHYRWVTLGGALGLVASVLMGIAVTFLSGPLLDLGPDLVGAAVICLAGGGLGVLTAAALGWTVFRGGTRLSVRHFFAATSVVLLLIAAGLFSTGLGKLQALGVLPVTDALWDSSALLSDHSLVGGFATGLVGYRARPTLVEVTGYMLYLITAGALFLGGRRAIGARSAEAR